MVTIDFASPRTSSQLAALLGCTVELIEILDLPDRSKLYTEITIPKRNGKGHRIVFEPDRGLAIIQKGFSRNFEHYIRDRVYEDYPHGSAHGFNSRTSIKTNALVHCGAKKILRIDIRSFFRSISRERVEEMFRDARVDASIIPILSGLVTISDFLPEGLPTSPLISNLVSLPLDRELYELASNMGLRYTRYADDITFSSAESSNYLPDLEKLDELLKSYGHEIASEKTRHSIPGQAHFVTGLNVQLNDRPTVPKKFKRRLRQELYYASKYGLIDHAKKAGYKNTRRAVNVIDGRMSFVLGIEPSRWSKKMAQWRSIMVGQGIFPSYINANYRAPSLVNLFIDESIVEVGDKSYFALAAVEFSSRSGLSKIGKKSLQMDLEMIRTVMSEIVSNYHLDPYSAGGSDHLPDIGLHHNDDPMDLQTVVVEFLSKLPMQIYLAFKEHSSDAYADTYSRTLKSLLRGRLNARQLDQYELIFEENSRISKAFLSKAVSEILPDGESRDRVINIDIKSKGGEPLLSVSDYALGVFFSQRKDPRHASVFSRRFERLRHRYRYIVNLTDGLRFNRRNPIGSFLDAFNNWGQSKNL